MVLLSDESYDRVDRAARVKETNVAFISIYSVEPFVRVVTEHAADLGDWLCQIMGICA